MFTPPAFISFGPELGVILVLLALAWLAFAVLRIATAVMAVRNALKAQWVRAVLWGGACFLLVAAVPLWKWQELRQASAAMERARIVRDVPNFTDKVVLYVPSRGLDDVGLACKDLVQRSGASTVYLTQRWVGVGQPEGADPVDPSAPIDLLAQVQGVARVTQTEYGEICTVEETSAPEAIDYVLIENAYERMSAPFAEHLNAVGADPTTTYLVYFIATVEDARAFRVTPEAAEVALFRTYADEVHFPTRLFAQNVYTDVPRDWREFERVIRQVVCREPKDAPEPTCWPFS